MSVPSDIPRSVEKLMVNFFYAIGSISLVVNVATLVIIIRRSSSLLPEIRAIAIFQQLFSLCSNAFLTILFIPFLYLRMGGGYCLGILCSLIPFQYLIMIQVFLGMSMISGVALMIIARHQMLIMDDSIVKLSKRARYCAFLITVCALHLETLSTVLTLNSNRVRQNGVMDEYIQLSWRERGLNWFLFFGPDLRAVMLVSKYGSFVQVAVVFSLILIPFAHMLYIVLRARKRMLSSRQLEKDVHIIHAQTIIIQFIVLILFIVFPFVPVVVSIFKDDVFRDMQTIVVIAEMVFVCSNLLNSFVIVWRNRNYRSAVTDLLRFRTPVHRRSISAINTKGC